MNDNFIEFKANKNYYKAYKISDPQLSERIDKIAQTASALPGINKNIQIFLAKSSELFLFYTIKTKLPKNTKVMLMPDDFDFNSFTDNELTALILNDYFRTKIPMQTKILIYPIICLVPAYFFFMPNLVNPYLNILLLSVYLFSMLKFWPSFAIRRTDKKITDAMGEKDSLISLLEKLYMLYQDTSPANAALLKSRIGKLKSK